MGFWMPDNASQLTKVGRRNRVLATQGYPGTENIIREEHCSAASLVAL